MEVDSTKPVRLQSSSPTPVVRAKRTYGRPRPPQSPTGLDDTLSQSVDSQRGGKHDSSVSNLSTKTSNSLDSILVTSTPPPSSFVSRLDSDGDDDDGHTITDAPETRISARFDWRKKLKAIDEMNDEDLVNERNKYKVHIDMDPVPSALSSDHHSSKHRSPHDVQMDTSPSSSRPAQLSDQSNDEEDRTNITLAAASQASLPPSPSPSPTARRKRRTIVADSESDSEIPSKSLPTRRIAISSPTSPAHLHSINTPNSRSSHTPPTSDDEMATKDKADKKGKVKALIRDVPSIEMLSQDEVDALKQDTGRKTRATKQKHKKPTKKEMRETAMEAQRLRAEEYVRIPRENQRGRPITDLFRKIANTSTRMSSTIPAAHVPSSDPITSWSSSQEQHPADVDMQAPAFGAPSLLLFNPSADVLAEARATSPTPSRPPIVHRATSSSAATPVVRPVSLAAITKPDMGPPAATNNPEQQRAQAEERRLRELKERKLRILEQQKQTASKPIRFDDEDEDLELVINNHGQQPDMGAIAQEAHEHRPPRPSGGQQIQARFAGLALRRPKDASSSPIKDEKEQSLQEYLHTTAHHSSFGLAAREKASKDAKKGKAHLSGTRGISELNRRLVAEMGKKQAEVTRSKEEEWKSIGGKLVSERKDGEGEGEGRLTLEEMIRKREEAQEAGADDSADEEEGEEEDKEWQPEDDERGSESPAPDENDGVSEPALSDENETALLSNEEDEDAEEKENSQSIARPHGFVRRVPRPRAQIVDSDDESIQDENARPKHGIVLVQDSSFIEPHPHQEVFRSDGDVSGDGDTDKENENHDKENQAALARWPLSRHTSGILGPSLNPSPMASQRLSDNPNSPSQSLTPSRLPLKDISEVDEQSPLHGTLSGHRNTAGSTRAALSFSERLQRSPSPSPMRTPGATLNLAPAPMFLANGQTGFSEFDDEEEGGFSTLKGATPLKSAFGDEMQSQENTTPKPLLKPGFGDFFDTESQAGPSKLAPGFDDLFGTAKQESSGGFNKLRQQGGATQDLSLTLDVRPALPALDVSEDLKRKAQDVFEKEQMLELQADQQKRVQSQEPELYVNEHGFLTQTRPENGSPTIYRPPSPSLRDTRHSFLASQTPTKRSQLMRTPSSQRAPLATLMYTPSQSREKEKKDDDDNNDPPILRLGRIRRRSVTPEPDVATGKPNAFDALRAGARKHEREKEQKEVLAKKSEFVEAEAVESDDDDGFFGGGRAKNDDDEDADGDDQDQTLAELVDDQQMSEDALNRQGVLEKHQEMEAEADAAIEKHAKEVVAGLHRRKRRNRGLGMDSDDEYEEDDLADERRRAKMARKRRINDDTLEDLAKHKETQAFYDSYQRDLADGGDDFAHLEHDQFDSSVLLINPVEGTEADENEDEDEDDNENQPQTVSTEYIRQQARQLAQSAEFVDDEEPMDVNDVSWMDHDSDDDASHTHVRTVRMNGARRQTLRPDTSMDVDDATPWQRRSLAELDRKRMSSWALGEGKAGTGLSRSTVHSAITGHQHVAKVKAGGGSVRSGQSTSSTSTNSKAKPITKAPSMLSGLKKDASFL